MVTVNIDLPIFSSPTEAFGYFNGPVELSSMPEQGKPFPWPMEWTQRFCEIFEQQSSQVWGISEWLCPPASQSVTMFGLASRSSQRARKSH